MILEPRGAARLFGIANRDRQHCGRHANWAGGAASPDDAPTATRLGACYNAEGIDGLRDRSKGHAKRALTPKQEQQIAALVPRVPEATLVCWRRVDLQDVIRARFGVV